MDRHPRGDSGNLVEHTREAVETAYRSESRVVLATLIRLLGGYFLIDARDLDAAIAIAAKIPAAHKGTVEVRPVIEITGLPTK